MSTPDPTNGMESNGGCHPFRGDGHLVGHYEERSRFRIGSWRNEDLPTRGVRFNTPSEVHGAADHAILSALLGANMAHHHLPGVNANAHVDFWQAGAAMQGIGVLHAQLHGEGTGDRPLGI